LQFFLACGGASTERRKNEKIYFSVNFCVHPTPLGAFLLQTKIKVQFDRAVTERSKPLFRFQSPSNPYQFFLLVPIADFTL
jgi:hypothetical protein